MAGEQKAKGRGKFSLLFSLSSSLSLASLLTASSIALSFGDGSSSTKAPTPSYSMVPTTCHMDPFGHSWLLPPQFHGVETSSSVQFSRSVMSDSATPWIVAHQASLSITNSWSSLKLTSIESVMPSSHLILCRPLLLLPPIPPSIRVFSNESTLRMRWPKYWNFSFSIIPSKQIPGLISFRMD